MLISLHLSGGLRSMGLLSFCWQYWFLLWVFEWRNCCHSCMRCFLSTCGLVLQRYSCSALIKHRVVLLVSFSGSFIWEFPDHNCFSYSVPNSWSLSLYLLNLTTTFRFLAVIISWSFFPSLCVAWYPIFLWPSLWWQLFIHREKTSRNFIKLLSVQLFYFPLYKWHA